MQSDSLLQRAASYLRTAPEPGWEAISAQVRAAVHAAARTGWPIRASGDAARGLLYISDGALRGLLAHELRRRFVCQPTRIAFTVEGALLRAVDIDITGSYGTRLPDLGDDVRRAVVDTVHRVLDILDDTGRPATASIDVTITDIVDGDPLH
ncbi:Asp23/Gls24 family envelope stress response protein [Mycolicibacterium cosmeticum]|jgi:hypothetical protein|uniref:Uncharacterized protein n=1 Tax=Mycolicibacterium cosmeticum TaxID=258533 RepID=W9B4C2_MYCCO|nr:Asp23/Gls24 family envelope stress response protein [Mycolicibacterium cosmeticum]TLH70328.1 Asp23/Gls24 family envelope stress response protein [Mycolicibacterium cosmeticum]CDO09927.1 hypothetical protein BN977_04755 [Mycolicibacterium cosmeticum]